MRRSDSVTRGDREGVDAGDGGCAGNGTGVQVEGDPERQCTRRDGVRRCGIAGRDELVGIRDTGSARSHDGGIRRSRRLIDDHGRAQVEGPGAGTRPDGYGKSARGGRCARDRAVRSKDQPRRKCTSGDRVRGRTDVAGDRIRVSGVSKARRKCLIGPRGGCQGRVESGDTKTPTGTIPGPRRAEKSSRGISDDGVYLVVGVEGIDAGPHVTGSVGRVEIGVSGAGSGQAVNVQLKVVDGGRVVAIASRDDLSIGQDQHVVGALGDPTDAGVQESIAVRVERRIQFAIGGQSRHEHRVGGAVGGEPADDDLPVGLQSERASLADQRRNRSDPIGVERGIQGSAGGDGDNGYPRARFSGDEKRSIRPFHQIVVFVVGLNVEDHIPVAPERSVEGPGRVDSSHVQIVARHGR